MSHLSALTQDEAKHGLILSFVDSGLSTLWPIGEPGQCAITAGLTLGLGDLTEPQCHKLAEITRLSEIHGVIGPDDTTHWFTRHAQEIGIEYGLIENQLIWAIRGEPNDPKCSGAARIIRPSDLDLMLEWVPAFQSESNPHDPTPSRAAIEERLRKGDVTLWEDRGEPVAMAGITRRLTYSAAITGVYTPTEHRGHGYAGAVTGACVRRIYAEGLAMASLYTDADYPASNRCYAKVGFQQICRSAYWRIR